MTKKAQYLSRRLAKEKTVCPGCQKTLQLGTLAWSHRCRVVKAVPDHVVHERLDKMLHDAHKSFQRRQARNAEPEAAALEDPTLVNATIDGAGNIAKAS
jgi:hypothetical protein